MQGPLIMSCSTVRYAIYYAPAAQSDLWAFGSALIGYDAATGKKVKPLVPSGQDPERWMALTAEPRRYGFHATLKAPFHLSPDVSESRLIERMQDFAKIHHRVALDGLRMCCIGSFIGMMPLQHSPELDELAAQVVRHFDSFRAPLSEAERERRLKSPLTDRQMAQLDQWGYPYVFEDFRFHMTLTGPVHNDDRTELCDTLSKMAENRGLGHPISIDRIVLFKQDEPKDHFKIISDAALQ
jgi:putative phosphonate metabolism protein